MRRFLDEAHFFLRRADQDATVVARYNVVPSSLDDAAQQRVAGVEEDDLAADREDLKREAERLEQFLGPGAGRDEEALGKQIAALAQRCGDLLACAAKAHD